MSGRSPSGSEKSWLPHGKMLGLMSAVSPVMAELAFLRLATEHFTFQDLMASSVATFLFLSVAFVPGYVLGWMLDPFGFRKRSLLCRFAICIPLSISLCPILAYLLWFHLLKVCGATAASAYHFLMPPLGMLFAFLVLGEHVEFRDLLGIVPVALGIYLVTRPATVAGPSK